MSKPTIRRIAPFDAHLNYIINFVWNGNRAYKNRIIINDAETLTLIYDRTITTYTLAHEIPQYTLTNGRRYVIQVQIFDEENTPSVLSDRVIFNTMTTPQFYFDNLPPASLIQNASFEANVTYDSPDFEPLSRYRFAIYDSSKVLIEESNELYDEDRISYVFRGLDNHALYFIRCIGNTANGLTVDTGHVEISVKYQNPDVYARIYTDNMPELGAVRVASNIAVIHYTGAETFSYENGMINLVGKALSYDEGFLINDDFTLALKGKNLWQTGDIFTAKNDSSYGITLSSRIYSDSTLRFKVMVPNGIACYLRYSEPLRFTNDDMITIFLYKKNNLYDIIAEKN